MLCLVYFNFFRLCCHTNIIIIHFRIKKCANKLFFNSLFRFSFELKFKRKKYFFCCSNYHFRIQIGNLLWVTLSLQSCFVQFFSREELKQWKWQLSSCCYVQQKFSANMYTIHFIEQWFFQIFFLFKRWQQQKRKWKKASLLLFVRIRNNEHNFHLFVSLFFCDVNVKTYSKWEKIFFFHSSISSMVLEQIKKTVWIRSLIVTNFDTCY